MSTSAQRAANQANAQLSTGPRTAEGKAAAAANSLRHGLTSAQLIVAPGEQEEFDDFLAGLTQDLHPEGTIETVLFNDVVHAAWQKRRARFLEAGITGNTPETLKDLDRLRRYHAHWDRLFNRAFNQLRAIQRERAAATIAMQVPVTTAAGVSLKAATIVALLNPPSPTRLGKAPRTGLSSLELDELELALFRTAAGEAAK